VDIFLSFFEFDDILTLLVGQPKLDLQPG